MTYLILYASCVFFPSQIPRMNFVLSVSFSSFLRWLLSHFLFFTSSASSPRQGQLASWWSPPAPVYQHTEFSLLVFINFILKISGIHFNPTTYLLPASGIDYDGHCSSFYIFFLLNLISCHIDSSLSL
jgi:hypothetical protein